MNKAEPMMHDDVRELLPWLVNDSLDADERDRVALHASSCVICRRELEELERLRDTIQIDAAAMKAPTPDMQLINARIDSLLARKQIAGRFLSAIQDFMSGPWRVAFLAQSLVLVAVLSVHFWPQAEQDGYRTLTNIESLPAGEYIRVAFDPGLEGKDVAALTGRLGLELVSGPSERGVATLRVPMHATTDRDLLISQLQAQPGVLFAQAVTIGGP